jgi:RNA polymerase sigma-70 factor (sigma-E family)
VDFEEFVSSRLDGLLRYATVLSCDPHLAQDIVQEVMLRAQERWARIGVVDNPGAYVKTMVTNEYLAWRRRRARRDAVLASVRLVDTADPIATYDQRDAMLAGIARLPAKQRAALVLRFYEGYADDEIAAALGCAAGTVRSHISRGVATLRTYAHQPVEGRL